MPLFQFPPYVMILFVSALINLGLGIFGLTYKTNRLYLFFGISFILAGIWPLLYGIELMIADSSLQALISNYRPITMQFFPVTILCFFFLLIKQKMPPGWLLTVLTAFAFVYVFTMITNDTFHLAWSKKLLLTTKEGYNVVVFIPSLWTKYVTVIYHFGVDAVALFMLIPAIIRHKNPYKMQFKLITLAIVFSVSVTFLYIMQIISFGPYNPIPASFAVTSSLIAFAVFKYKMLDITPYARESVFEFISNPVIITDQEERLLDFNEAAAETFRLNQGMISKDMTDIFSELNLDYKSINEDDNSILETKWGAGGNYKYSAVKKNVRKDTLNGYFVIFTDVTAQIDSIKTEHEKEIVTYKESILGDMHDGIGGTVATAAIIAQAALEEEEISEKNRMIAQIGSLLENGSFELRSMLNILDKDNISWSSLVFDMRAYSSTVLDAKSITRKFEKTGEAYGSKIDFDVYLSIFRLFKEAVTNIIKHSDAQNVQIHIEFKEDKFNIIINDDGKGIDSSTTKGYGIKNMTRRAEKLGGTLDISAADGTNVYISIPV